MSNQLVSDAEVDAALDWLRDNAKAIGQARREAVKAEHMLKHTKAMAMKLCGETAVSAQEREAYASEQYAAAIDRAANAAGVFEEMKSLREAAALKIEVYRSASANYRAMKL
jgi:hypothetical protein